MHITLNIVLIGLVVSMAISPVYAAGPIQQFVFQGVLKDSTGALITAVKRITLRIFDIPTGGPVSGGSAACTQANHCFWEENQTTIAVTNGVFTINAGNKTSLAKFLNFTNALYLEVIVRDTNFNSVADEILKPRINMTSVPFALAASRGVGTNATTAFNVTNISAGPTLIVKGGSTTANVLNVTAGSLTTGSALNVGSTSGSTGTRNLASIANSNTAATGTTVLKLTQAANQIAAQITGASTTANVLNVTAGSLTTGSALRVGSTSGDTGTRNLVDITSSNPAATATIALRIKGEAATANVLNATAGSLTTGSLIAGSSTSGSTAVRSLLNVTNDNSAATGTTVLRLQQRSTGDIVNFINKTGARSFVVNSTGDVKLGGGIKFNSTTGGNQGIFLKSILIGSQTPVTPAGAVTVSTTVTVTGARSGDVAACSFKGAASGTNSAREFLTISNVTTDKVFVNATKSLAQTSFTEIVCIVFHMVPSS